MSESEELATMIIKKKNKLKEITNSDEFMELIDKTEDLEDEMNDLRNKRDSLVEPITLLEKAIDDKEKAIIKEGIFDANIFKPKHKIMKEVNVNKLYNTIGEQDQFMLLVSVTQKAVKDYAKDNKEQKDELLDCIEEKERRLVGLTLIK